MHNTKQTGLRLPQGLLDRLDGWCARQRPPVTRTALVTMVLSDWIDVEEQRGATHRVGVANGTGTKEVAR